MNQRVTVIGTGRMGSALALALFHKGFATTVWNRTASKAEPLARLGLSVAPSVLDAVRQADIVVVNISDYGSTLRLLQQPEVESALRGKILVQLSSGAPKEAREMETWARRSGISYLDGAILSYPKGIGTPECTVVYSGPEEVFHLAKPVLLAFGGAPFFVGKEIGQAAAFDIAALTFAVSAMLGFLQGSVVWEGENLPAGGFQQSIQGLMPVLMETFADMSQRLQKKDYSGDQATLEAYSVLPRELLSWCQDRRTDHTLAEAFHGLMDRAIQAGHGQEDFSYLYEVLKALGLRSSAGT